MSSTIKIGTSNFPVDATHIAVSEKMYSREIMGLRGTSNSIPTGRNLITVDLRWILDKPSALDEFFKMVAEFRASPFLPLESPLIQVLMHQFPSTILKRGQFKNEDLEAIKTDNLTSIGKLKKTIEAAARDVAIYFDNLEDSGYYADSTSVSSFDGDLEHARTFMGGLVSFVIHGTIGNEDGTPVNRTYKGIDITVENFDKFSKGIAEQVKKPEQKLRLRGYMGRDSKFYILYDYLLAYLQLVDNNSKVLKTIEDNTPASKETSTETLKIRPTQIAFTGIEWGTHPELPGGLVGKLSAVYFNHEPYISEVEYYTTSGTTDKLDLCPYFTEFVRSKFYPGTLFLDNPSDSATISELSKNLGYPSEKGDEQRCDGMARPVVGEFNDSTTDFYSSIFTWSIKGVGSDQNTVAQINPTDTAQEAQAKSKVNEDAKKKDLIFKTTFERQYNPQFTRWDVTKGSTVESVVCSLTSSFAIIPLQGSNHSTLQFYARPRGKTEIRFKAIDAHIESSEGRVFIENLIRNKERYRESMASSATSMKFLRYDPVMVSQPIVNLGGLYYFNIEQIDTANNAESPGCMDVTVTFNEQIIPSIKKERSNDGGYVKLAKEGGSVTKAKLNTVLNFITDKALTKDGNKGLKHIQQRIAADLFSNCLTDGVWYRYCANYLMPTIFRHDVGHSSDMYIEYVSGTTQDLHKYILSNKNSPFVELTSCDSSGNSAPQVASTIEELSNVPGSTYGKLASITNFQGDVKHGEHVIGNLLPLFNAYQIIDMCGTLRYLRRIGPDARPVTYSQRVSSLKSADYAEIAKLDDTLFHAGIGTNDPIQFESSFLEDVVNGIFINTLYPRITFNNNNAHSKIITEYKRDRAGKRITDGIHHSSTVPNLPDMAFMYDSFKALWGSDYGYPIPLPVLEYATDQEGLGVKELDKRLEVMHSMLVLSEIFGAVISPDDPEFDKFMTAGKNGIVEGIRDGLDVDSYMMRIIQSPGIDKLVDIYLTKFVTWLPTGIAQGGMSIGGYILNLIDKVEVIAKADPLVVGTSSGASRGAISRISSNLKTSILSRWKGFSFKGSVSSAWTSTKSGVASSLSKLRFGSSVERAAQAANLVTPTVSAPAAEVAANVTRGFWAKAAGIFRVTPKLIGGGITLVIHGVINGVMVQIETARLADVVEALKVSTSSFIDSYFNSYLGIAALDGYKPNDNVVTNLATIIERHDLVGDYPSLVLDRLYNEVVALNYAAVDASAGKFTVSAYPDLILPQVKDIVGNDDVASYRSKQITDLVVDALENARFLEGYVKDHQLLNTADNLAAVAGVIAKLENLKTKVTDTKISDRELNLVFQDVSRSVTGIYGRLGYPSGSSVGFDIDRMIELKSDLDDVIGPLSNIVSKLAVLGENHFPDSVKKLVPSYQELGMEPPVDTSPYNDSSFKPVRSLDHYLDPTFYIVRATVNPLKVMEMAGLTKDFTSSKFSMETEAKVHVPYGYDKTTTNELKSPSAETSNVDLTSITSTIKYGDIHGPDIYKKEIVKGEPWSETVLAGTGLERHKSENKVLQDEMMFSARSLSKHATTAAGGMQRAFPTFVIIFIKDYDTTVRQRVVMADMFMYVNVLEFTVRSHYLEGSVATAKLGNLWGTLDNNVFHRAYREASPGEIRKSYEIENKFVAAQLKLAEGTLVEVRHGYSANIEELTTVFTGKISEVASGDITEIIMQGHEHELMNPVEEEFDVTLLQGKNYYDYCAKLMKNTRYFGEPFRTEEIALLNKHKLVHAKELYTTQGTNRWGTVFQESRMNASRATENIWIGNTANAWFDYLFNRDFQVKGISALEALHEITRYHGNCIAYPMPYDHRATLFMGSPDQPYKYTSDMVIDHDNVMKEVRNGGLLSGSDRVIFEEYESFIMALDTVMGMDIFLKDDKEFINRYIHDARLEHLAEIFISFAKDETIQDLLSMVTPVVTFQNSAPQPRAVWLAARETRDTSRGCLLIGQKKLSIDNYLDIPVLKETLLVSDISDLAIAGQNLWKVHESNKGGKIFGIDTTIAQGSFDQFTFWLKSLIINPDITGELLSSVEYRILGDVLTYNLNQLADKVSYRDRRVLAGLLLSNLVITNSKSNRKHNLHSAFELISRDNAISSLVNSFEGSGPGTAILGLIQRYTSAVVATDVVVAKLKLMYMLGLIALIEMRNTSGRDVEKMKDKDNRDSIGQKRYEQISGIPGYRPFRRYHMIYSAEIIRNEIECSTAEMANEVHVMAPRAGSNPKDMVIDQTLGTIIDLATEDNAGYWETIVRSFNRYQYPSQKIIRRIYEPNAFTLQQRNDVVNRDLSEAMKYMYRGAIQIIGRKEIKPYDIIIIKDRYNQIYGEVEVRSVTHSHTYDQGYVTTIVPSLLTMAGRAHISPVMQWSLAAMQFAGGALELGALFMGAKGIYTGLGGFGGAWKGSMGLWDKGVAIVKGSGGVKSKAGALFTGAKNVTGRGVGAVVDNTAGLGFAYFGGGMIADGAAAMSSWDPIAMWAYQNSSTYVDARGIQKGDSAVLAEMHYLKQVMISPLRKDGKPWVAGMKGIRTTDMRSWNKVFRANLGLQMEAGSAGIENLMEDVGVSYDVWFRNITTEITRFGEALNEY